MRLIGWEAVIESVDLEVFMVMVRLALEPTLRSFDVLYRKSIHQCFEYMAELRLYFVRHGDDRR